MDNPEAPKIEMMTPFQSELMKIYEAGFGKRITSEAGTEPFCGIILPCNRESSKHIWMFSEGSVMVTSPGDKDPDQYIETTENLSKEFVIDRRSGSIASDASPYIEFIHTGSVIGTIKEIMSSQYAFTPDQQKIILNAVAEAKQLMAEGYRALTPTERRDQIANSVLALLQSQ